MSQKLKAIRVPFPFYEIQFFALQNYKIISLSSEF
jgi:hypothetical protein